MIRVRPDADVAGLLGTLLDLDDVTPAELARRSGYAEGQVSRWRRGVVVPSSLVLLRLLDALGYEVTLSRKARS